MTKRHEAKYKIDRRMGQNVWGRPKSPINHREYGPGQHGQRRKGKLSDYGVQLRAKQKLRGYYGNISERQFRGIYQEAIRMKGDSGAHMIGLLESRLDAIVYRAKLVPTVFAARQLVSHGHLQVNGRRVTIPSYRVKVGDVIEVKEKSKQLALDIELRDGRPVRIGLDPVAQIVGFKDVQSLVAHAEMVEDLHDLSGKAAHRELRGALHEQHHVIALDLICDELLDGHEIPHRSRKRRGAPQLSYM